MLGDAALHHHLAQPGSAAKARAFSGSSIWKAITISFGSSRLRSSTATCKPAASWKGCPRQKTASTPRSRSACVAPACIASLVASMSIGSLRMVQTTGGRGVHRAAARRIPGPPPPSLPRLHRNRLRLRVVFPHRSPAPPAARAGAAVVSSPPWLPLSPHSTCAVILPRSTSDSTRKESGRSSWPLLDLDGLPLLQPGARDSRQQPERVALLQPQHPARLHQPLGLLVRLVGAGVEVVLPPAIGLAVGQAGGTVVELFQKARTSPRRRWA